MPDAQDKVSMVLLMLCIVQARINMRFSHCAALQRSGTHVRHSSAIRTIADDVLPPLIASTVGPISNGRTSNRYELRR